MYTLVFTPHNAHVTCTISHNEEGTENAPVTFQLRFEGSAGDIPHDLLTMSLDYATLQALETALRKREKLPEDFHLEEALHGEYAVRIQFQSVTFVVNARFSEGRLCNFIVQDEGKDVTSIILALNVNMLNLFKEKIIEATQKQIKEQKNAKS